MQSLLGQAAPLLLRWSGRRGAGVACGQASTVAASARWSQPFSTDTPGTGPDNLLHHISTKIMVRALCQRGVGCS